MRRTGILCWPDVGTNTTPKCRIMRVHHRGPLGIENDRVIDGATFIRYLVVPVRCNTLCVTVTHPRIVLPRLKLCGVRTLL